jgi:hypothetical protein
MSTARVAEALVALLVGCAVIVTTAACGAPEYTYVKNSSDRTYFKVPASWRLIDEKALKQMSGEGSTPSEDSDGTWAVAYDAADVPSPAHLVDKDTSEPIVYASVQQVPVTPAAREGAAAGSATFTDFNLVEETVLTPPGFRGVHEVFQYRVQKGPLQTFDKTAYVNSDASKVYVMLLRCSSECYQARRAELESVTASFTVQEGS